MEIILSAQVVQNSSLGIHTGVHTFWSTGGFWKYTALTDMKFLRFREIRHSHGGDYENYRLLVFTDV
jgi:hypothetical protein